jgi:hypothetical protein
MIRALSASAVVLLLAVASRCGKTEVPQPAATGGKKVWAREDMKKAVTGKAKDAARTLIGEPGITMQSGSKESWQYSGVTRDPAADRIDTTTWVDFDERGFVEDVRFVGRVGQ